MHACIDPDPDADPFKVAFLPRPNDFSDAAQYFVLKAVLEGMSLVRSPNDQGAAYGEVQQRFVDLLTYNDNALNPYSDSAYLAWLMQCLSNSFVDVPFTKDELDSGRPRVLSAGSINAFNAGLDAVEHMASVDRLVPSYRNAITIAALHYQLKLMLSSLSVADTALFLPYTRCVDRLRRSTDVAARARIRRSGRQRSTASSSSAVWPTSGWRRTC